MLSRLAAHFSRYSIAGLLVTLASIVSFPFLTRIFPLADYGMMSLIGVLVTTLAAIGKLGLQQAALRFYSEVKAGHSAWTLAQYEATVYVGQASAGTIASLLWIVAIALLPDTLFASTKNHHLLYLVAPLALLQCLSSAVINQLRARELSGILSLYSVIQRYAGLALIVLALLYISTSLWGLYGAQMAADALCLSVLAYWFFHREPWSVRDFSLPFLKTLLTFSLPLVAMELSSVMLSLGDRILIQRMLGPTELGIYSAPYNLCEYIAAILVTAFTGAITPMVLRLWANEGEAVTQAFLQRVFHLYLLFAIPMVAGVSAIAEPLLLLVASEKYRAGAVIIPSVMGGVALQGLFPVATAGLQIRKRSGAILLAILSAAVVNLLLNLLLIPLLGIQGSAIATLLAYGLMTAVAATMGRNTVTVHPEYRRILTFLAMALLMYLILIQIHSEHHLTTLIVRMVAGTLIYAAGTFLLDRETRDLAKQAIARMTTPFRGK
ncbi:MAG: oligosaccharide flippase family protein [Lautropia sp.]|nr:oligosaccharide flippase family protein [Lautropia sp.]